MSNIKNQIDLSQYIPENDRNVLNMGLFKNIVNKLFTKQDSKQLFGWISADQSQDRPFIIEKNADRTLNTIEPILYTSVGDDEYCFTFSDMLDKLKILGVDIADFANIGACQSFNLMLPINLDKFVNFSRYRWVGHLTGLTSSYNTNFSTPDYIVIAPGANTNAWTDANHWVHEADLLTLGYDINQTTVALRPIIEYHNELELNRFFFNDAPAISSTAGATEYTQAKNDVNTYPLFNLYYPDQDFTFKVSSIVKFAESETAPLDTILKKRIIRDNDGEIYIEHGLVDKNDESLYMYKLGSAYNIIWTQSEYSYPKYASSILNGSYVELSPLSDSNNEGAWVVPPAFKNNIEHITKKIISYSDLSAHFRSIMSAQPLFTGNPNGANNFRSLSSIDYGLGGYIKDFNTNLGIFMGLINQVDFSIPGVIDFAQQKYDQLITSSRDFVLQNILTLLQETNSSTPTEYNENSVFNSEVLNKFKNVLSNSEDAKVLVDTTSGLKFSIITTPYIRAFDAVEPQIIFDALANTYVLQHHDGHKSALSNYTVDELQQYCRKYIVRSDGNSLPGMINNIPPAKPYKNQLWFDTTTQMLKHYNVVSDESINIHPPISDNYWYDRQNNVLYKGDGNDWVPYLDLQAPWKELQLDIIVDELIMSLEREIYSGIPKTTEPLNLDIAQVRATNATLFDSLLEKEFLSWCYKNNISTPYSVSDLQDSFTWNYSQAVLIAGLSSQHSTWQALYEDYFGTTRPDMEPWVLQGYTSQPLWWEGLYGQYPYAGSMWDDIKNDTVPGYPAPLGAWTKKLGVNTTTGELLPPVVFITQAGAAEALYNDVPIGHNENFTFGDLGEDEINWRASIEFLYDVLNVAFKIQPIQFIDKLFGFNNYDVNGYTINKNINKKINYQNLILHGEEYPLEISPVLSDLNVISPGKYEINIIETLNGYSLFNVVKDGVILDQGRSDISYVSPQIEFTLILNGFDFSIGDKFEIVGGQASFIKKPIKLINGISQWLINFLRYNSIDLKTSAVNAILRGWEVNIGHRFGGLVNSENIQVKSDYHIIPDENVSIILKHNERIKDFWIDTIDIDLIKSGTGVLKRNTFVPANNGEDWTYQIKLLNNKNQFIKYYEFDTNGSYSMISSDNVLATGESWKKYHTKTQVVEKLTPFTVNSMQEVINIIYGYAEYCIDQGWTLNNAEYDLNTDKFAGTIIDWDTEIQRFINAQYIGTTAGDGVFINPFKNRVWFKNEEGIVSNFALSSSYDPVYSPAIFDVNGNPINTSDFRVYRSDTITEIHSDVPMMSIHLFIDTYEHILLMDNYIGSENRANMIYDPFTGISVPMLFISTDIQRDQRGDVTFDGYYLNGNNVTPNICNNIDSIGDMYDVEKMINSNSLTKAAQSLIGYDKKKYLNDLGYTDKTQFSFWRGMLKNKGTVDALNAFVNNKTFNSEIVIDEYWAYKVAQYGDARPTMAPEIKLQNIDAREQYTKIQFIENESPLLGYISITDTNDRWYSIDDEKQNDFYFTLENFANVDVHVAEFISPIVNISSLIDIPSSANIEVYATADLTTPLIAGVDYDFINSTTIRLLVNNGVDYIVKCYRESYEKHNPLKLIDYKNNQSLDIILWDPIRGAYPSESLDVIDIISDSDPAKYNYSLRSIDNETYVPHQPWGDNQVGTVWFDTSKLEYIPYNDNKIFPLLQDRLSKWGKQYGPGYTSINEWVQSPVHPSKYDALVIESINTLKYSGTPSFKELYSRNRVWENRVVAWKYSDSPGNHPGALPHEFFSNNVTTFSMSNTNIGSNIIYLENDTWPRFDNLTQKHFTVNTLTGLIGEAQLSDTVSIVSGSSLSTTVPAFVNNADLNNFSIEIINENLPVNGTVIFSNEQIGVDYYIRALNTNSNITQAIKVIDTPNVIGARVTYTFDFLNIRVNAVTLKDHSSVGFTNENDRLQKIAQGFGNVLHDVVIREAIVATNIIPFDLTDATGWILYETPSDYSTDFPAPFNKWEPVFGLWIPVVESPLTYSNIDAQKLKPIKNINGDVILQYRNIWNDWALVTDDVRKIKYDPQIVNFFEEYFDFTAIVDTTRVSFYVNGLYKIMNKDFTIVDGVIQPTASLTLNEGDILLAVLAKYVPTEIDLAFNEDATASSVLTQYRYDYQYVEKEVRNDQGELAQTNYYFWVTNSKKEKAGTNSSVLNAINSMNHQDSFAVIDNLKLATADKPHRFTHLIIRGISKYVNMDDTFKLKLTNDHTFRDDPANINLKNVHNEWMLISENQNKKIPYVLWEKLVFSLAGKNMIGQNIPALDRVEFDTQNGTKTRYGFKPDQTLVDKDLGMITLFAILKDLEENPFDFIDVNDVSASFSSPAVVINTMMKMYESNVPATNQVINKIFFAILYDILAMNYELTDIFKTSYISFKYIKRVN